MYSTRIYYQDTDAGGVVYYANYLSFFERSWFEYLLSIDISLPEWEEKDTFIIVKTAFVDLIEKLRYGDTIEVDTAVKETGNAFFVLEHTVWKGQKPVTRGETKMVCVTGRGKPKRMPPELKEKLQKDKKSG